MKQEKYTLSNFDGSSTSHNQGIVDQATEKVPLRIGGHWEKLSFDITGLPETDVVLGIPWLRQANP